MYWMRRWSRWIQHESSRKLQEEYRVFPRLFILCSNTDAISKVSIKDKHEKDTKVLKRREKIYSRYLQQEEQMFEQVYDEDEVQSGSRSCDTAGEIFLPTALEHVITAMLIGIDRWEQFWGEDLHHESWIHAEIQIDSVSNRKVESGEEQWELAQCYDTSLGNVIRVARMMQSMTKKEFDEEIETAFQCEKMKWDNVVAIETPSMAWMWMRADLAHCRSKEKDVHGLFQGHMS